MAESVDLLVIGSGAAGATVAGACRQAGWSVLMAEQRTPGGTCPNRGCDPKKTLVEAVAPLIQGRRLHGHGCELDGAGIDWPALMRFKRGFTEPIAQGTRDKWREAGVELVEASARFLDAERVGLGDREIRPRHVCIAAGSRPRELSLPGADLMLTSDDFLELEQLPRSLVFVGGGYIGVEFASIAAAAGSEVTLIHRGHQLLKGFDPDCARLLADGLRDRGITCLLGTEPTAIERGERGRRVVIDGHGALDVDAVVHAAGRVPNTAELDCAAAGIDTEAGAIVTDRYQRSSRPHIYAAGDCTAGPVPALLQAAVRQAKVAVAGLLGKSEDAIDPVDPALVPAVCFSDPPVAAIGLSEAAARERLGDELSVRWHDLDRVAGHRRLRLRHTGSKVLVHRDRIVGAHLIAPHAEDTVNVFLTAMAAGLGPGDLRRLAFSYPSHSGVIATMVG